MIFDRKTTPPSGSMWFLMYPASPVQDTPTPTPLADLTRKGCTDA